MFGTSWRTTRTIVLLLVLAALIVPAASSAATPPTIVSATVFGNVRPGDPNPETDPVLAPLKGPETLFANSRPFGFRHEHGIAYVEGKADGDLTDGKLLLFVDIIATDGVDEVRRTVTVQPKDDPEMGKARGDFKAELDVWELGVHKAAGTPDSDDPADWGGADIDFIISGRATDGTVGPSVTRVLTKYAGTPRDTFAPSIGRLRFPPAEWCHFQAQGAEDPFGQGFSFGGTADGSCGDFAPFIPLDPTWVYCTEPAPGFSLRQQTTDPIFGTGESLWANQNFCPARSATSAGPYMPQGHARVAGEIDDFVPAAFGVASEISDVTIEVFQGDVKLREFKNVLRQGPQAAFGMSMNINDFEPNTFWLIPFADPYIIKVTACDAWSNCTTVQSHEIYVHPY